MSQQLMVMEKKSRVYVSSKKLYADLISPKKYSKFFANTFLSTRKAQKIPPRFEFVARITKHITNSHIHGIIESIKNDDDFKPLLFDFDMQEITDDFNMTELTYRIYTNF
ncbi:MAG: hypothetical protein GKS07_08745 [Nitrosopumilus sp.]|nr:MAG: hypothetical protein GKS07_08745 [Nitrosopumilus sp.]